MSLFKKLNNITGWVILVLSFIVYYSTLEATVSFWDCGEFILAAYKLEVVHPPGAPFFLLLGRLFTLFAGDPNGLTFFHSDTSSVAFAVNVMSGLSSALGIMFLFWIITHMGRKMLIKGEEDFTLPKIIAIIGAGVIGAWACTFLDTYWFSAVEGEVYALSTLFMIFVFWAMLKWEEVADEPHGDRWIVFIALMIGLSIGVHLMSLLAIPAMALIYYFRKYTPTVKGGVLAFVVGFVILFAVYIGIVSWLTSIMGSFDIFFVNNLGLPFGSGAITFMVLLVGAIIAGIIYSHKKNKPALNTALLSFVMILIGFSTYAVVVIRSNANPPINMNKPADLPRLLSYLNREQYGDRPLLRGPLFDAYPIDIVKKGKKYVKGEDKYIYVGDKIGYKFDPKDIVFFPRMGSWQDNRHVRAYRAMLGLEKDEKPTYRDNIWFFVNYQVGFMWFRYFMWNFSGRQNDIQGRMDTYDSWGGRWITGFKFIDNKLIGPVDKMPERMRENPAYNRFYMLPFILGLIGLLYHFGFFHNMGWIKEARPENNYDQWVVLTLFLFTGIFEVVFFNSPPFEPRERDYTLVGSFVTYTIWIGLGVLALFQLLKRKLPVMVSAIVAFLIAVPVPAIMGAEGWDDHDRSERYTARDFAINYLESCAPNAILFTQGDNDTYPLWYAQEVEGIRTDVRIVNLSLLGVDWYIDQLRYKINDAPPVKLTLTPDKYLGNKRDVVRYYDDPKFSKKKYYDLREVIKFIARDDRGAKLPVSSGELINYLPTKNFMLPVDSAYVVSHGIVPPELASEVVPYLKWKIKGNNLLKNDLMTLDIVASNLWERPVYFAVSVSPDSYQGLEKYFQLEGLAYRIVPIENPGNNAQDARVATDLMYERIMTKFRWGNMESGTVYLDENIRRMCMNLRSNFARLAEALIKEGKKDKALEVLNKALEVMPESNVPYDIFMIRYPELYFLAGDAETGAKIARRLAEIYRQDFEYFSAMGPPFNRQVQQSLAVIQELARVARQYNQKELEEELKGLFEELLNKARLMPA